MAGVILHKSKTGLAKFGMPNAPIIDSATGAEVERQKDERTIVDNQINGILRENIGAELDNILARASLDVEEDNKSAIISDLVQIHQINFQISNGYLAIGQILLGIYNRSREVYDEIASPYAKVLPMGHNVALKLRRIAEEVQRRNIDLKMFPSAYSTIYEIVTLEDRTFEWVMNEKLIHPKIQRGEIQKWKKLPLLSGSDNSIPALRLKLDEKIREKDRLIDEHEKRIRRIEAEIGELRQQIKEGEDVTQGP